MYMGKFGSCDVYSIPRFKSKILIDDINEIVFIGVNTFDPTIKAVVETPFSFRSSYNCDTLETIKEKEKLENKWNKILESTQDIN